MRGLHFYPCGRSAAIGNRRVRPLGKLATGVSVFSVVCCVSHRECVSAQACDSRETSRQLPSCPNELIMAQHKRGGRPRPFDGLTPASALAVLEPGTDRCPERSKQTWASEQMEFALGCPDPGQNEAPFSRCWQSCCPPLHEPHVSRPGGRVIPVRSAKKVLLKRHRGRGARCCACHPARHRTGDRDGYPAGRTCPPAVVLSRGPEARMSDVKPHSVDAIRVEGRKQQVAEFVVDAGIVRKGVQLSGHFLVATGVEWWGLPPSSREPAGIGQSGRTSFAHSRAQAARA